MSYINRKYKKTLKMNELLHRVGESITVMQFYLQRLLCGFVVFLFGIILIFGIHSSKKDMIIHYTDDMTTLSAAASKSEMDSIKDTVKKYSEKYKKFHLENLEDKLKDEMGKEDVFWSTQVMTMSIEEVVRRIDEYQKEYFKWWELLIVLLISGIAFQVPYWVLLYKKKFMQMNMEDEIIQYHTIILMLMYIERISTHDILSWIENFAVIFKTSIEECLNEFSAGEREALMKLREKELFEPFQRLIDNFLMCDRIGVRKAFDEIAVDRKNYQEKRRQENEFYVDEKAAEASIFAFIPFTLVVGLYMIIPLVMESLTRLYDMLTQFQL